MTYASEVSEWPQVGAVNFISDSNTVGVELLQKDRPLMDAKGSGG